MSKSLDPNFLRLHIRATLQLAGWWSADAEELMLGTSAQETHLGYWREQMKGGPGKGIYSIELNTEEDIWFNYLRFRPIKIEIIRSISGVSGKNVIHIRDNLAYQHLLCRTYYHRQPGVIPSTLEGQAKYWDDNFNRNPNAGTPEEYIANYNRYVKGIK